MSSMLDYRLWVYSQVDVILMKPKVGSNSHLSITSTLNSLDESLLGQQARTIHSLAIIIRAPGCRVYVDMLVVQTY